MKQALRRGLGSPLDRDQLIAETQALAREQLLADGTPAEAIDRVWATLTDAYFLRHAAAEIAWHTAEIAARDAADASPLVAVAEHPGRGGATVVLVATHGRHHSFARATAALDQAGLSIQDARITATADGGSLDTYLVLEDTGQPITDRDRMAGIERQLEQVGAPVGVNVGDGCRNAVFPRRKSCGGRGLVEPSAGTAGERLLARPRGLIGTPWWRLP